MGDATSEETRALAVKELTERILAMGAAEHHNPARPCEVTCHAWGLGCSCRESESKPWAHPDTMIGRQ